MIGVNHIINNLQTVCDLLHRDISTVIDMHKNTHELVKSLSDTHVELNGLVQLLADHYFNLNNDIKDLNNKISKIEQILENKEG